jgi:hypothetical protein
LADGTQHGLYGLPYDTDRRLERPANWANDGFKCLAGRIEHRPGRLGNRAEQRLGSLADLT